MVWGSVGVCTAPHIAGQTPCRERGNEDVYSGDGGVLCECARVRRVNRVGVCFALFGRRDSLPRDPVASGTSRDRWSVRGACAVTYSFIHSLTLRHSRSPATRPSMRTRTPRSPQELASRPAAHSSPQSPVTTRARRRANPKVPQGTPKARPHPRQHRAHARPRPCQPATPTTRDDRHGTTITPCKHTVQMLHSNLHS